MKKAHVALAVVMITAGTRAWSQSMPPRYMPNSVGALSVRGPTRIAETAAVPMLSLSATAVDEPELIADLRARNTAGRDPVQLGVVRHFLRPSALTIADHDGTLIGSASVHVDGARRLRLHVTGITRASQMWVWGSDGRAISFGIDSCTDEGCWSPSVFGEAIFFEAQGLIDSKASIDCLIDGVDERQVSSAANHPSATTPSCFQDASCVTTSTLSNIADYRRAVAQLDFADSSGEYGCTGALINNGNGTPLSLLLTANHCISTSALAASVEAFWDYRSLSCGGAAPSFSTLPRSVGASMIATSTVTDFSLLRLSSLPAGRYLLGWDSNLSAAAIGTRLYRISHPAAADGTGIYVQTFSSTTVSGAALNCGSLTRPSFLASTLFQGATDHGSSGAPTINSGGYIVGQLLGVCAPTGTAVCSTNQLVIDGAFSQTYPSVAPVLYPSASCTACVADAHTACALGGRFKVTLRWHDQVSGSSGTGSLVKYAENTPETNPTYGVLSEMVYFSFYADFPKSVEVVAKMVKGVGINDKFWAFATSVNTSEYWVDITDTQSCRTWTGHQPFGQLTTVADFAAFPFP